MRLSYNFFAILSLKNEKIFQFVGFAGNLDLFAESYSFQEKRRGRRGDRGQHAANISLNIAVVTDALSARRQLMRWSAGKESVRLSGLRRGLIAAPT